MKTIVIRGILPNDYDGIREVDVQTQKQYLGIEWDILSDKDKEKHLVSRKEEFAINVDSGYSFVASLNNQIIGFLFAYETLPFLGNIYIRYIGIVPQYQKHGIGLLLYQELIKEAKKNGIKQITALINLDNPNSIKLHQKLGFTLKNRKEAELNLSKGLG